MEIKNGGIKKIQERKRLVRKIINCERKHLHIDTKIFPLYKENTNLTSE